MPGTSELLERPLTASPTSTIALPDVRRRELRLDAVAQPVVARVEAHAGEVARERADVLGDRHLVVVEHDDERRAEVPDVVERLERHAAGHRPVADDDEDRLVAALRVARAREPERDRERVRGVAGVERVVGALAALGEAAHAAVLPQRGEALATPGEELVDVGLVPDVEDDPVVRAVERAVNAERELDDAEVGRQVAAGLRDRGHEFVADLLGELRELGLSEALDVARRLYGVENSFGHEPHLFRQSRIESGA